MSWKERFRKNLRLFADNGINLLLLSILTGLFAGVVITFYNILMSIGETTSEKFYTLFLENPAFVPLLFLALAAGALVIGTAVKFVPMIRGSGIPQIEGAARGVVRFKWYVTLCSMFAASLACVFLGYPAGAEGPSLEMGGCAGSAAAQLCKRNFMVRRLQIAAGSSAGLAVAFNAPVTGLVFALEEAFRSFSPQVFICAAVSVVTSLLTRNAIRLALNMSVGFSFTGFDFAFAFDAQGGIFCLWTALAAVIVSLFGVGFYHLVFASKKLFKRVTFLKGIGKYIIPFFLAGAFGLITLYSLGGGHSFIEALATGGTGAMDIERVFGLSVILSLIIIVIIRFITAVLTMGCGVPCGVFIPMLAVGAGLGAILSLAFQKGGMSGEYSDYLVIICMAAFFTCIVKAPVTGIVMVFELTGRFANLLPAIIGVAIGYLVGMLFKTEGIYEKNLAQYIKDEKISDSFKKVRVNITVMPHSRAEGRKVRQIIWPANGLVVERVTAAGDITVPDGETLLCAGDKLVFECETDSEKELRDYLTEIVGKGETD
ncbi:MAG: chloride channel protein [Clostridia bacterium]|nr:chloride channel protein [Clostridia bacterium]